jgi:hypothetical protein
VDLEQEFRHLADRRGHERAHHAHGRRGDAVDHAADRPAADEPEDQEHDRRDDARDGTQARGHRRDEDRDPEDGEVAGHDHVR